MVRRLHDFYVRIIRICTFDFLFHRYYVDAGRDFESSSKTLDFKTEQAKALKSSLNKEEKKFRLYLSIDESKEKLEKLHKEYKVAKRNEAKRQFDEAGLFVDSIKKSISSLEETIEKQTQAKKALEFEKENVEDQLEKAQNQGQDFRKELNDCKMHLKTAQNLLKKTENEKNNKLKDKRSKVKQLESVQKVINELKAQDAEGEAERKRNERSQQLKELNEQKETLEAKFQSTKNHLANLQHSLDESNAEYENLRMRTKDAASKVRGCDNEISGIKRQGNNKLILFGDKMPNLVAEIERNVGKFNVKPIGPLGMFVELKEGVSQRDGNYFF